MKKSPAIAAVAAADPDKKKSRRRKVEDPTPNDLRPNNSTARIARFFDCSESTVRDWIARGLLPAGKVGRRRIVAREDALAFIRRPGVAA